MASDKVEKILERIEKLTIIEAAELVKLAEERWGVSAVAPVAMAATPAAAMAAADDDEAEEQTEFTVILQDVGPKKIQVIKAVRALISGLGLREAKELVESAPKPVMENVDKEQAEAAKKGLEEAGATVELK